MLAAPGKLVAHGTPVSLKSNLGEGYTVVASFMTDEGLAEKSTIGHQTELLDRIRTIAPLAYTSSTTPNEVSYHLKLKDPAVVQEVLELVEETRETYGVASYSVMSTSIEDIFLGLMHDDTHAVGKELEKTGSSTAPSLSTTPVPTAPVLHLTNGRRRSPPSQALTIFHKRVLIARRSWLTPCLAVLIAVAGSCVPIFFLSTRQQTCVRTFRTVPTTPVYLPVSPLGSTLR